MPVYSKYVAGAPGWEEEDRDGNECQQSDQPEEKRGMGWMRTKGVFGWLQADTVAAVWTAAAAIHREKNTVEAAAAAGLQPQQAAANKLDDKQVRINIKVIICTITKKNYFSRQDNLASDRSIKTDTFSGHLRKW